MLWYKDLPALQHDWLLLQYESMLGKGHAKCNIVMTATYTTLKNHTRRVDGVGFFSSPDLFGNLHTRAVSCCGSVRQNLICVFCI
jgi:hypothetical protein